MVLGGCWMCWGVLDVLGPLDVLDVLGAPEALGALVALGCAGVRGAGVPEVRTARTPGCRKAGTDALSCVADSFGRAGSGVGRHA